MKIEKMNLNKENKIKKYLLLYLKALGIGAADTVPGISGGTIAFITGIYEELVNSLRSFVPKNFKLFFTGRINEFWKGINGNFLLIVFLGIATSLILLAKIVLDMLDTYPIATWSFFFGLILVSTYSVLGIIREVTMPVFIAFGIGAIAAFLITLLSAAQTPNELWFIFVCGAVAICAMILPGISGSFILLLLGKYQYMLAALNGLKIEIIAVFVCGAAVGLLSFSHFLSWLLRRYHDVTVGLLAGFMFGALNRVWPWKVQTEQDTGQKWQWSMDKFSDHSLNIVESSHLPHTFEQMTGVDANLYAALAWAAVGIIIFKVIEKIGTYKKKQVVE